MSALNVLKIGGNIIDDPHHLSLFLRDFALLTGPKILVHGGGKVATDIGHKLGITPHYMNGRRVTDAATLELVTMVYGGLLNKKIVAGLQQQGANAIGLTGADGALLKAKKRAVKEIDYGFAGDIERDGVNHRLLRDLLNMGTVPVIAPLSFSTEGSLLNTNADTIANEIAKAMCADAAVNLIYCFEQKGVLQSNTGGTDIYPALHEHDFLRLQQEGVITGGMIPKLENAFAAIRHGVKKVVIGHAEDLHELLNGTKGTTIL